MNCNEVKPRLIEAVYGEVPAEFRAAFEEHLAGCPACRLEYERLEQADQALDLVPETTAAVDLSRLYRDATARSRQSSRRWLFARRSPRVELAGRTRESPRCPASDRTRFQGTKIQE